MKNTSFFLFVAILLSLMLLLCSMNTPGLSRWWAILPVGIYIACWIVWKLVQVIRYVHSDECVDDEILGI